MLAPKERKIFCLNNISATGLSKFREGYKITDNISEAAGILVRSADMKDMDFPEGLRTIARAGAGVNNIPIDRCSEAGIVVFNTPGANANSVKELVIAGPQGIFTAEYRGYVRTQETLTFQNSLRKPRRILQAMR